MRRRLAAAAVCASMAVAAGCASNAPGDLSASAAGVLRPAVEDVRQAAASGSYADLRRAVDRLKSLVEEQQQSGDVSADRAIAIEDAADGLLQDARPTTTPTPSPTTSSPSPSATPTTESPTPSESASPSPSDSATPTESESPVASVSVKPNPLNSHSPH